MRSSITSRAGTTLLELTIVLTLIGIVSGIAAPRLRALRDRIDVRGAANDADALYAFARRRALARMTRVVVSIDPAAAAITVVEGTDTVARRAEWAIRGVRLDASRGATTYGPTGAAIGGSNLTLVLQKGAAADTLTVSRIGRVRR